MGESELKKVVDLTGMWWPAADSGRLRQVADVWRAAAEAVDEVTAVVHRAARAVVGGNRGPAVDAFASFWERYYRGGGAGALPDAAQACRQLATACEQFADRVDEAEHRLEEEAAIAGAALIAGGVLAFFTGGLSEAAAAGVSASIVAAAESIGVSVSAAVADISATTLTGVAFGALESTAVDGLVAQPVRVAFGDGGFSGTELLTAAETGGLAGGVAVRLPTALDSLPGRMALGAGLGAGQDAVLDRGSVNPFDVVAGAVGGAAGKGLSGARREELVPDIMGRPQNMTEGQFRSLSDSLKGRFTGIDGEILIRGSRAGYTAHGASDLDIMVRVGPQEFDRILDESYGTAPAPGSARERSLRRAQRTGVLTAGEVRLKSWSGQPSLGQWRDQVLVPTANLPVDLTIVHRDSPFADGPKMPIR